LIEPGEPLLGFLAEFGLFLLMFLAGFSGMLAFLLDSEPLLILNTPLQVIGLLIFLWRMRKEMAPSRWRGDLVGAYSRTAVLGLVVAVVLTAIVVNKFVSGTGDEEALFEEILPWLLALDHSTFLLVVTNVVFGMLAVASIVSDMSNRIIYYGMNVGAVGFIVGLIAESKELKRTFTPILGIAILYGIYVHLTAKPAVIESDSVPV